METIFDKPQWFWRLADREAPLIEPNNHQIDTAISVVSETGSYNTVATVALIPPTETFFFLRSSRAAPGSRTYYFILIVGNRAYLQLHAVDLVTDNPDYWDKVWTLFYWTKSTAPVWLRKYLHSKNEFLRRRNPVRK